MAEKADFIAVAKTPDVALVASSSDLNSAGYDMKNLEVGEVTTAADVATEEAIDHIEEEFTIESSNSPFAEVRANVPNSDDPELPINTFRMWFLGVVFTMVRSPSDYGRDADLNGKHRWEQVSISFSR